MEILSEFYNSKLKLIQDITELASDSPEEVEAVILDINSDKLMMLEQIKRMKEEIAHWRIELKKAVRCAGAYRQLWQTHHHMLDNVPHQARPVKLTEAATISNNNSSPEEKPSTCPDVRVTHVSHLTLEQFDKVPKYMKGRLSYDNLSLAVEEFNKCVTAKYQFLAKPISNLGLKDKKKRNILRSQEQPQLKNRHFVTIDELKDYTMFRTEASRKSIITVLRHFQKIREVRGPGAIVRFVVN